MDSQWIDHVQSIAKELQIDCTKEKLRAWIANPWDQERLAIETAAGKIFPESSIAGRWCDWYQEGFQQNPSAPRPNCVIGIIHTVFFECGGTETWARHFVKLMHKRFSIAGLACLAGEGVIEGVPVAKGLTAVLSLASVCDVVILWGLSGQTVQAIRNQLRSGARVIHVHHGDTSSDWSEQIIKESRTQGELLICVNPEVATKFDGIYIPNAVDPDRTIDGGNPESPTVLFMHRFSKDKNPLLAIEACRSLPAHWKFLFAGRGELWDQAIQAAGEDPRFQFVRNASPKELFPQAQIFLSLSRCEGFGYSVAEAAASNLRVVSYPVGIANDSKIAKQIPMDVSKPEDIASYIIEAQKDRSACQEARHYVRSIYSQERFMQHWIRLLSR